MRENRRTMVGSGNSWDGGAKGVTIKESADDAGRFLGVRKEGRPPEKLTRKREKRIK